MSDLNTSKGLIDWFLKKDSKSSVIVLLLLVTGYLGYTYYRNNSDRDKQMSDMKSKIELCLAKDKQITDLKFQIEELKLKFILLQANASDSPNAQWLTDASTGNVLWVNPAYEAKYLKPLGKRSQDLIGNNGFEIFGETQAERFVRNNNWVIKNRRPRTFNEIEKTLKYPVEIGDFIFAVGGMEYETFE